MVIAAIYLRQSLDRTGEGLAVARQQQDCENLCQAKGWKYTIYVDNDTSASTGVRRPGYEQMLQAIRDGQVGAVVAWDLDRLHRRPIELEQFMEIADEKHIALATVTGDVDLSTDNGRLFARIKGAVAKAEVERKNARQMRALLQRAQSGKGWGKRAFGYTSRDEIEPRERDAIQGAYSTVLRGGTLWGVASEWNKQGFKTGPGNKWTSTAVRRVLLNPRNVGVVAYRGEWYPAQWEAIIDEDTWRKVKTILENPARRKGNSRKRVHLLTGLATCGLCGTLMGVGTSGKENRRVYTCKAEKCSRIQRDLTKVDALIVEIVSNRLSEPDAVDLLVKTSNSKKAELMDESAALTARKKSIALKIAQGLIDDLDAEEALRYINQRLKNIENSVFDLQAQEIFGGLIGADDVKNEFAKLPLHRRQAVIDRLMTITINPAPRGRGWHPECVGIRWRDSH